MFLKTKIVCVFQGSEKIKYVLKAAKLDAYLNAAKILDDFEFQSDDICPGLKAADGIANFLRKICKGTHIEIIE